jgi:hypothetical protein
MTDMNMKTSSNAINKLIKAVKTTGDKYNVTVQEAVVAIIRHANDYGDCTGAARLVDAMPRSNRRQLVVDHFAQYSPINVVKKGDAFSASLRKPYFDKEETKPNKAYNPFNIEGVKANNWWERAGAERLPDVVNYDNLRSKLLSFFESQLKKADTIENDNDKTNAIALIRAARAAASNFNAEVTKGDNLKGTEWDDEAGQQLLNNAA